MDQATRLIVVFCGPHYDGRRHFGRIDESIALAKTLDLPLLICGDGNNGKDLEVFHCRAHLAGVSCSTVYNLQANTRGDAQGAVEMLSAVYRNVKEIILITDWYHMRRAQVALEIEMKAQGLCLIEIITHPIFDHLAVGLERLPGEEQGIRDYLKGRKPRTWGDHHFYKPALEQVV